MDQKGGIQIQTKKKGEHGRGLDLCEDGGPPLEMVGHGTTLYVYLGRRGAAAGARDHLGAAKWCRSSRWRLCSLRGRGRAVRRSVMRQGPSYPYQPGGNGSNTKRQSSPPPPEHTMREGCCVVTRGNDIPIDSPTGLLGEQSRHTKRRESETPLASFLDINQACSRGNVEMDHCLPSSIYHTRPPAQAPLWKRRAAVSISLRACPRGRGRCWDCRD